MNNSIPTKETSPTSKSDNPFLHINWVGHKNNNNNNNINNNNNKKNKKKNSNNNDKLKKKKKDKINKNKKKKGRWRQSRKTDAVCVASAGRNNLLTVYQISTARAK